MRLARRDHRTSQRPRCAGLDDSTSLRSVRRAATTQPSPDCLDRPPAAQLRNAAPPRRDCGHAITRPLIAPRDCTRRGLVQRIFLFQCQSLAGKLRMHTRFWNSRTRGSRVFNPRPHGREAVAPTKELAPLCCERLDRHGGPISNDVLLRGVALSMCCGGGTLKRPLGRNANTMLWTGLKKEMHA